MELEKYGVKELNAEEIKQSDGGSLILAACCVALAFYFACEIAGNPSASGNAFMDGWNSVQ